MMNRRVITTAACALLLSTLSGCEAIYFLAGRGSQDPVYKFDKKQRVLVFVDSGPSVTLPPNGAAQLAEAIGDHLYKYKAAELIVGQDRLSEMRRAPGFSKLGIADIAAATDADVVLYINVVNFNVDFVSADNVSQGNAQTLVKVVDKNGKRLWPADEAGGSPVEAAIDPKLTDAHDQSNVLHELFDRLGLRIGRMFHSYSLDDKDMIK